MNSALFAQSNSVIPVQGATDFSSKQGYGVTLSTGAASARPLVPIATLSASATVPITAVILDGNVATIPSSVGLLGGLPPIRLKLSGAVAAGATLIQAADGTFVTDPGTGARVVVGTALEDGISGDLIQVQTYGPQIRS
jgi:hypothetical protein